MLAGAFALGARWPLARSLAWGTALHRVLDYLAEGVGRVQPRWQQPPGPQCGGTRSAAVAGMGRRRVSDAEYLYRQERELRGYGARHSPERQPADWVDPGEAHLSRGRLAWVADGHRAAQRWSHYASGYARLLVMRPNRTWRPWDWRGVG